MVVPIDTTTLRGLSVSLAMILTPFPYRAVMDLAHLQGQWALGLSFPYLKKMMHSEYLPATCSATGG
jgi:hypothetical protein